LFDYEFHTHIDSMIVEFWNVTLKQKMGPYDIGAKFDYADIYYNNKSKIDFYNDDDGLIATFKLKLVLVEE
jgi:hypothetical protein